MSVRGRPFKKGEGGRKPGSINKTTAAVQEAAQKLVEDPAYRKALAVRLMRGTAGAVEPMLWHYAYGKPKETLTVEGGTRPLVIDVLKPDDV